MIPLEIDTDEHDLIRDEVLEALQDAGRDSGSAVMAAHAQAHVTAGMMILAGLLTRESFADYVSHVSAMSVEFMNTTADVAQ